MQRFLLFCGFFFAPLSALLSQITVTGQIVDETSKPLVGVVVTSAYQATDTTDQDGRFSILHPQADKISLQLFYNELTLDFNPNVPFVPNEGYTIFFSGQS